MFYSLKVEQLIKETDDTITVCFKQPALKKVKYVAGQYITVIFRINGRRYARPYSFSSSPGIDSTINITIKRVQGGVVSNHILDTIKAGDIVEVIEPMGDFTLDKVPVNKTDKHLVFWGSGSGITPLISIIKFALVNNVAKHITLVYGNRNSETTIFSDQLTNLQQKFASVFNVWHFFTRSVISPNNPFVIEGRINPKKVIEVMSYETDMANTIHFICGPVGLKNSVKNVLNSIGIPDGHIFSEDFEVTRDPKDFEGINTQPVLINFNKQKTLIEVTKGKSILESGLDALLDLSYSCQTGSCLLCKAKVASGEIKMIGIDPIPQELNADECLLCCSFPLTDNVEILIEN